MKMNLKDYNLKDNQEISEALKVFSSDLVYQEYNLQCFDKVVQFNTNGEENVFVNNEDAQDYGNWINLHSETNYTSVRNLPRIDTVRKKKFSKQQRESALEFLDLITSLRQSGSNSNVNLNRQLYNFAKKNWNLPIECYHEEKPQQFEALAKELRPSTCGSRLENPPSGKKITKSTAIGSKKPALKRLIKSKCKAIKLQ